MRLFEDKQRHQAEKVLKTLLSLMSPAGLGGELKTNVRLRHFAALANQSIEDHNILISLRHMATKKKTTLEDFEHIFRKHIKRQHSYLMKRENLWKFLIPISIKLPTRRPLAVKLLGVDFRLLSWPAACRNLGKRSGLKLEGLFKNGRQIFVKPQTCIVVDSKGFNWGMAWPKIDKAFDAFRGILEIVHSFGQTTFSFGQIPYKRRSKIGMPPWAIAFSPRKPLELVQFPRGVSLDTPTFEASKHSVKELRRWAFILSQPVLEKSILTLVIDGLRLYAQALDAELDYQSFLGFWQLAETLTLASSVRGDGRVVAKRLSWFAPYMNLNANAMECIILKLFSKRNEIVHSGVQQADQEDINMLKLCCESGISWLTAKPNILTTQSHLEDFFQFIKEDDGRISRLAEVLRFIQTLNKKLKPQIAAQNSAPVRIFGYSNATAIYERKLIASRRKKMSTPILPVLPPAGGQQ